MPNIQLKLTELKNHTVCTVPRMCVLSQEDWKFVQLDNSLFRDVKLTSIKTVTFKNVFKRYDLKQKLKTNIRVRIFPKLLSMLKYYNDYMKKEIILILLPY